MFIYPRIFQISNCDGEPAGLYVANIPLEEMENEEIVELIENTFADCRNEEEVQEAVDEILEKENIFRVFAEEVNTDVI